MAHTGNNTLSNILLILGGDELSNEKVKELLIPIIETWRNTRYVHSKEEREGCHVLWLNMYAGDVSWMIKIEACPIVGNPYVDLALNACSDWDAKEISFEIRFDCLDSFNAIYEALGV